jgi:5-methylcytosine-specific restriction endonuclease McrA
MKIELKHITIRELTEGYEDKREDGVVGYGGKLDIRPPFQREFVYKPEQRNAVINTVNKGYPLNVMYWAVREDGTYEIIDGQQRTISICQYKGGDFSVRIGSFPENRAFHNLKNEEQEQILDYKLTVYMCEGTDIEKLKWFETINIAGEVLTKQELKNAVFSGSWVTAAKKYFSKNGCYAYNIGSDYLTGNCIRQDYLETTIKWKNNGDVDEYMSTHQNDEDAEELKDYLTDVIEWVEKTFPNKRNKLMKGQDWGTLYNTYKDETYDADDLEEKIKDLIIDDDVSSKKGIYPYLLTGKEKYLSIRAFTEAMKQKVYVKQGGKCIECGDEFDISKMEADHINPWHAGGKTNEDNCQMLCKEDNRKKSGK